jgi:hypothetical protein
VAQQKGKIFFPRAEVDVESLLVVHIFSGVGHAVRFTVSYGEACDISRNTKPIS